MGRTGRSANIRTLVASALAPLALLASAASPAPDASPSAQADRVYALSGTWSCRSAEGALVRSTGVRDGNTVKVHDDVDQDGKRTSFDDRYTFDPAQQRWHVVSGFGGFTAEASPWSGDSWTVQGNDVNAVARRMTIERLPNGDLRRSLYYQNGAGVFVLDTVERCAPGPTPPPVGACIADRYPPATLEAAPVNGRFIPRNAYPGVVQVVISLNERSEIVDTRVQSTTSRVLNQPALAAARASKFRTAIVNCKPIAADYIFTVTFDAG